MSRDFETGAPRGDGFYAQLSAAKESVIGLFPYQRRRESLTPYHLFEPIATENTCGVRGHESNRRWWSRFWSRTYADTAPLALLHPFLHKCYDGLSYCTSPHYRLIYTRVYFLWDVRVRNVLLPCSFPTIFGRAPATCGGGR